MKRERSREGYGNDSKPRSKSDTDNSQSRGVNRPIFQRLEVGGKEPRLKKDAAVIFQPLLQPSSSS